MVDIKKSSDADFREFLLSLLPSNKAEMSEAVINSVGEIIKNVKERGDQALVEYTNKFDNAGVDSIEQLIVKKEEIESAYDSCDKGVIESLELAAKRIHDYHARQMPEDFIYNDDAGVRLGNIWKAIKNVAIYVPGGLASYPSSVLMNAIPARVAGSENITMLVPAPNGTLNPAVLAAAKIANIDVIYKVGGAQAIAAVANGTETVDAVDKIVGPGNAYVAAAKKYFYGNVGIDMIAGPSEILVVADNKNDPNIIAMDLLSQAEHDKNARSVLITDDEEFAKAVSISVENNLKKLTRGDIAKESWRDNGAIIVLDDLGKEAVEIIDFIAPEHLELALGDDFAQNLAEKASNAGAIFMGRYTPEAIGDYTAGPSHVLPTAGTARFSSGLSVYDFLKRVSLISCNKESFGELAQPTEILAENEGLEAHALSVSLRKK